MSVFFFFAETEDLVFTHAISSGFLVFENAMFDSMFYSFVNFIAKFIGIGYCFLIRPRYNFESSFGISY